MATRYKRIDRRPFRFALALVSWQGEERVRYRVITRSRSIDGVERWIKLHGIPCRAEILDSASIDFPSVYGGQLG